jgi:hypothetical protein
MPSEKTCELHGTVMRLQRVPLHYGLPVPDPDLWDARKRLFPNAKTFLLGGCCAGSMGNDYEDWVCAECRKAEARWRRKANWREEPWQHWSEK